MNRLYPRPAAQIRALACNRLSHPSTTLRARGRVWLEAKSPRVICKILPKSSQLYSAYLSYTNWRTRDFFFAQP